LLENAENLLTEDQGLGIELILMVTVEHVHHVPERPRGAPQCRFASV
jgi:hypothetical protein